MAAVFGVLDALDGKSNSNDFSCDYLGLLFNGGDVDSNFYVANTGRLLQGAAFAHLLVGQGLVSIGAYYRLLNTNVASSDTAYVPDVASLFASKTTRVTTYLQTLIDQGYNESEIWNKYLPKNLDSMLVQSQKMNLDN